MEIAEDVQMAIFHFIKQQIYCKFSEEMIAITNIIKELMKI